MILIWLNLVNIHLLVFQANCFSKIPSGTSGFPKPCLEKCTPNEANPIATLSTRRSISSHHYYEPPCSTSKRPFIDIDLNCVPGSSQEKMLSEDVPAKKKRRYNPKRLLNKSGVPRASTSWINSSLLDVGICCSTQLNSFPPETTGDLFSKNALEKIPSKAGV